MSRFRAAAIHFGLSSLVFVALAYLVVFVWYPDFFFNTDGGWEGMRIIVLVDLVLGPLLTCIVFRSGKPGLKFDLTMIGILQVCCLAAGVWVVHSQRPIALVFVDGSFFSMSRDDFTEASVAVPDLDSFPGPYPKWITVNVPDDPTAQSELRSRMLSSHTPLTLATELYVPFTPDERFTTEASDLADIKTRDWENASIPRWLETHGGNIDDYHFYLFGARYKYAYLGFRRSDNSFVEMLDVGAPYAPDDPA